ACWRRLRFRSAHRADAPASVAGSAMRFGGEGDGLSFHLYIAGPAAILREPGIVHDEARPIAADEARLLDRNMAGGEADIGCDRTAWLAGGSLYLVIDDEADDL